GLPARSSGKLRKYWDSRGKLRTRLSCRAQRTSACTGRSRGSSSASRAPLRTSSKGMPIEGNLDYALARVHARHGQRLDEADWHRLETNRDLGLYLAALRSTALSDWV